MKKNKLSGIIRGYLCRKHLRESKDNMGMKIVKTRLDMHIQVYRHTERLNNNLLGNKKIRQQNFPSEISENIVKFLLFNKYNIMPCWDTETGDLILDLITKKLKIEVKAFSSTGPTSFGPTESWDFIYFLDATRFQENYFVLYEVKISNTHSTWQQLKFNTKQTFQDQCDQKRRPRLIFSSIKEQLGSSCQIIYEGNF